MNNYTPDQATAMQLLQSGHNVFLTGDAGTGKTFLLREFVSWASKQTPPRRILRSATTGIAAQNIDGRTIHSVVKWSPQMSLTNNEDIDYEKKAEALKNADILIVDEVSMLTPSFLRYLVNCIHLASPLQIIFVGDFFQLPPVKCKQFAFETHEWVTLNLFPIMLTTVVRQTSQEFVQLLRQLRHGDPSALNAIKNNCAPQPLEDAICLCAHTASADRINSQKMNNLLGESLFFQAYTEESPDDLQWKDTPLINVLHLKIGARVLITANNYSENYCNGSMGVLVGTPYWSSSKQQEVLPVRLDSNGRTVEIPRLTTCLTAGVAGKLCKVSQFPLAPAYAITIHKSQGQTFSRVNIIDGRCWENGQLYVALSRARSLGGLFINHDVDATNVRCSQRVLDFYSRCF